MQKSDFFCIFFIRAPLTSTASAASSPSWAPLETKKGGCPPNPRLYTLHPTLYAKKSTLHSTLYTSSYAAHQTTFQKKENLHSSKVLITISSERSKKVLLAQMVYDGLFHHQQR